jgi:hypothetical protein
LVVADKALTAKKNYNLRVVETLVGARVLARKLGLAVGDREKITLREVIGKLTSETDVAKGGKGMDVGALMEALKRMESAVEDLKPQGSTHAEFGATLEEMIEMSGLPAENFHEVYLSWVEGGFYLPLCIGLC